VQPPGLAEVARDARKQAFLALMTAVRAADEHEEHAERRWGERVAGPGRSAVELYHQLERPLQVMLRFHEGPGRPFPVDVLEYGENGRKLTVALPPELPVLRGQWGEIHLMGPDGRSCAAPGQHAAPQFSVAALEPGKRVTLAVLSIEPQG
jgi:hypothetical protein